MTTRLESTQEPNFTRRRVLAMAGGAVGLLALGGVARAAGDLPAYPDDAFKAKKEDQAFKDLFEGKTPTQSDKVKLTAPEIAANGAVVPISVEASLPDVTNIYFVVPKNPYALVAEYVIPKGTKPYVSNRVKMGQTSDVVAVVKSGGKYYSAKKSVKVTVGGCGG